MWNRDRSVTLSIVVCFIVVAILTIALFVGPWAIQLWFHLYRGWNINSFAMAKMLILFAACFYPCSVFGYLSLYSLLRLLFNIKQENIFIRQNVKYLRRISWCCFIVAIITLIGGVFYIPYLFVAMAAGFVGLMLRIVKNILQSAVEIREENELTI
ncbi:MAG: DUF2975 domain-containing protein [Clostridia bacterium]|nr:DUF2975 domain-containing protein [Clostridia bacterium]